MRAVLPRISASNHICSKYFVYVALFSYSRQQYASYHGAPSCIAQQALAVTLVALLKESARSMFGACQPQTLPATQF